MGSTWVTWIEARPSSFGRLRIAFGSSAATRAAWRRLAEGVECSGVILDLGRPDECLASLDS